ncbi:MAG: co-chaperone DjlA [Methylococcaceae bacterium]
MSWLGKVVGGACGFLVGGPIGAVFGATMGHQFDKGSMTFKINRTLNFAEQQRVQQAFLNATFSVMGHIAKASGRVTPEEIAFANRVMAEMGVMGDLRTVAIHLFQQGKKADFPLDVTLAQFYRECGAHYDLLRKFLDIQLQAAMADGILGGEEERILLHICNQLKISRFDYERIKLRLQAQQRFQHGGGMQSPKSPYSLKEAYSILGLSPSATQAEVKKAYRRLMSKHHPDKLAAQGLSEEMMRTAKEKTQAISKAYETIQKSF